MLLVVPVQVDALVDKTKAELRKIRDSGAPMPTRCLIVGGFSESQYVCDRLMAAAAEFGVKGIQVDRPALAVMRGAVLFGLQPGGPGPTPHPGPGPFVDR